jgi:two-component system alkaline phosphatase synthesis response regulator PhoP
MSPVHSPLFSSALLVEDEPNLMTALQISLGKLEIPTVYATTIAEARVWIEKIQPEFILLDRSLPDGDGLDLCASLRAQNYRGTILILTALSEIEDRVKGLNYGADDYLPKPFSWPELEARIRALARRKTSFNSTAADQSLGSSSVPEHATTPEPPSSLWDTDEKTLRILGPKGWVELTPLEFKLACNLIQKKGTIISRNGLLQEVWGFTLLPKTRTVDHFLGRLRKYFEQNSEDPQHFLTIRGAGYKFQP